MGRNNRYREMEKRMTRFLLIDLVLFFLYLVFAANDINWLKVILSLIIVFISVSSLILLYLTGELKKPRSLWMTTAAGAILLCLLFSLILNYP